MPDYSVIELLCKELNITLAELLDGEEKEPSSIRVYDEEQVKSLLSKIQYLEKKHTYTVGVIMAVIGFICAIMSPLFVGSNYQNFASGCLCGLGISLMVVGILVIVIGFRKGH